MFNEFEANMNNPRQHNYSRDIEPGNSEDVMTVMEWIGVLIVLGIPIINIIMYFIWAFGRGTNENLKNFCKATLVIAGISILLGVMLAGCMARW